MSAETTGKHGILVPDWNALRQDREAHHRLIDALCHLGGSSVILSGANTPASPVLLRDHLKHSYLTDSRVLSPARLARLCDTLHRFDGTRLQPVTLAKPETPDAPRLGYVVSNGFGLGHVTRMKAIAHGLAPYGPCAFMSYSGGLVHDSFYLPSPQYLDLDRPDALAYTREATRRFLNHLDPTHIFYDGNVLPEGLLAALAQRPHIHLTWVRRGMWQAEVAAKFMAQQALVDLVLEPGDLSDAYDTGPSWQQRYDYCAPGAFLKTPPIRALNADPLERAPALTALGLAPGARYALLMLGASQKAEDTATLQQAVAAIRRIDGMVPVIAHWPISHAPAPRIEGAIVLERLPISPFYKAFDVIVSAAGYNSFHELLAAGYPTVFVPQEDAGRDDQLARARYAADRGLAQLCRRDALDRLDAAIARATPHHGAQEWCDDWTGIATALGISPNPATLPALHGTPPRAGYIKAAYKSWRGRKRMFRYTFVLAIGMSTQAALRKLGQGRDDIVVVTDSVDPIALRRAGFKYLWLNCAMLSPQGYRRQLLSWFEVWKPKAVRRL